MLGALRRKGYHGVGLNELLADANAPKGVLYHHFPGGKEAQRLLTDYAHVNAQVGAVLSQVHGCRMPPADGPPLTAEGRKILQSWLVCGAPNN